MRLRNSKFDIWWPPSWDSNPNNLCLTQNQASLTLTHSQKRCTLSCKTPHTVQLGEAVMLNLMTLSFFTTMLWTIKRSDVSQRILQYCPGWKSSCEPKVQVQVNYILSSSFSTLYAKNSIEHKQWGFSIGIYS